MHDCLKELLYIYVCVLPDVTCMYIYIYIVFLVYHWCTYIILQRFLTIECDGMRVDDITLKLMNSPAHLTSLRVELLPGLKLGDWGHGSYSAWNPQKHAMSCGIKNREAAFATANPQELFDQTCNTKARGTEIHRKKHENWKKHLISGWDWPPCGHSRRLAASTFFGRFHGALLFFPGLSDAGRLGPSGALQFWINTCWNRLETSLCCMSIGNKVYGCSML